MTKRGGFFEEGIILAKITDDGDDSLSGIAETHWTEELSVDEEEIVGRGKRGR